MSSASNFQSLIYKSKPRAEVQVLINGTEPYEGPLGTPLKAFIRAWEEEYHIPPEKRAIAAIVDNQLRELTYPVRRDVRVRPVTLEDSDGGRIYRRTLSFILVVAVYEIFGAKVVIDHAMPGGAYYCWIPGRERLTGDELAQIKTKMQEIVDENAPIERGRMPLEEARTVFAERDDEDKLRLLKVRDRDYLSIYRLRGYVDYFFGYMAPSTDYIRFFDVEPGVQEAGFVLRYPRPEQPGRLSENPPSPKLFDVFRQTGVWLSLIGISDIGQLNERIAREDVREIILVAEALHERRIAQISERIVQRKQDGVRVVLIAGPSSSGKTSFARRLAIQLMTHGLKPFTLGMDDYFVNREDTPLDENGEYDFENLDALRIDQLNQDLLALIAGEKVTLPEFDFLTGTHSPGRTIQLSQDHVIILEGIHGMNPNLTPGIPPENVYRIYISALTQLNIDRHNRIPTTDVRLLRRIVRDANHRNYTAEDTLGRWPSVRSGEKRNIFPYQENADVMFNSALVYELAVLRPFAEPLLLRIDSDSPLRIEAHRLLSFLRWVRPMDCEYLPDNSLLREFVGGSILRDYHPGAATE